MLHPPECSDCSKVLEPYTAKRVSRLECRKRRRDELTSRKKKKGLCVQAKLFHHTIRPFVRIIHYFIDLSWSLFWAWRKRHHLLSQSRRRGSNLVVFNRMIAPTRAQLQFWLTHLRVLVLWPQWWEGDKFDLSVFEKKGCKKKKMNTAESFIVLERKRQAKTLKKEVSKPSKL